MLLKDGGIMGRLFLYFLSVKHASKMEPYHFPRPPVGSGQDWIEETPRYILDLGLTSSRCHSVKQRIKAKTFTIAKTGASGVAQRIKVLATNLIS